MDLSRTSVFLDFDGTISERDTGVHLLERLGSPGWQVYDRWYEQGAIGSLECIARQWEHLPRDAELLRAVAAEVPLDPGFAPLVAALRDAGAEVTVVSDGFGFHVAERCAALAIPVITSDADPARVTIEFPFADPTCPCGTCGTCKRRPIVEAQERGRRTVLIGDGVSDREAAKVADLVFAKDSLASWCAANGLAYRPFSTLDDVRTSLLGEAAGPEA